MYKKSSLFIVFLFAHILVFAQNNAGNYLSRCNEKLVEIIMEDLFTPPVASGLPIYPNMAGYEVLCYKDHKLRSLEGQLKDYTRISSPSATVDLSLSAIVTFNTVARRLVYSEYMVDEFQKKEIATWLDAIRNDNTLLNNSVSYGQSAAGQIIVWLRKDNHDYTRTLNRYLLVDYDGTWQPTAPDYANAAEPNWPLLRSFLLESAGMIKAKPPQRYSEQKSLASYKSAQEVYRWSVKIREITKTVSRY